MAQTKMSYENVEDASLDRDVSSKIMDSSRITSTSISKFETIIPDRSMAAAKTIRLNQNPRFRDHGSHIDPAVSAPLSAPIVQPSVIKQPTALGKLSVAYQKSKPQMSIGQILDSSNIGRKHLTSITTEDLELASPVADFILGSPLERL
ncbi:hypothetical protein ACMFMG_004816 [Clarireedia jacksonii]